MADTPSPSPAAIILPPSTSASAASTTAHPPLLTVASTDFASAGTENGKEKRKDGGMHSRKVNTHSRKTKPPGGAEATKQTFSGLTRATTDGLQALEAGRVYPPEVQTRVGNATFEERQELVTLGSCYADYIIALLFYEALPKPVLSRGSITRIRGAITSRKGLNVLSDKFGPIPLLKSKKSGGRAFFAVLGALATASDFSAVKDFLALLLDPVIKAVCKASFRLPSLRSVEAVYHDATREILVNIRAIEGTMPIAVAVPNASLKRRHSSGYGNSTPGSSLLVAPNTPDRGEKRRKSFSSAEKPSANNVPEKEDEAEENSSMILGANLFFSAGDVGTSSVGTVEQPEAADIATVKSISDEGEDEHGDNAPQRRAPQKSKKNHNLQHDGIQLAIITRSMQSDFCAWFPLAKPAVWASVLSIIDDRDPLETCGDAAMYVVLTEILLDRLRDDPNGEKIFRAIHGPLGTNSTFLHFLQSARCFTKGKTCPKHPGNAFEVFAGALASFESLTALKSWITLSFEPLIEAAIKAWKVFEKTKSASGVSKGKGKEKVRSASALDGLVIQNVEASTSVASEERSQRKIIGLSRDPSSSAVNNEAPVVDVSSQDSPTPVDESNPADLGQPQPKRSRLLAPRRPLEFALTKKLIESAVSIPPTLKVKDLISSTTSAPASAFTFVPPPDLAWILTPAHPADPALHFSLH